MSLSSEPVNSDLTASHDSQNVKVEAVPQDSDALKTEPTTTPPSSPPVLSKAMASQSQEMPPPAAPASKTRKRSRGESADVAINVPDSSAASTVADDIDPLASQDKEQDTTTDSTATVTQNQRLSRSSQPAPTSAQSAQTSRKSRSEKTEKKSKMSKIAPPAKPAQQGTRSDESEPDSDMTTISNDPGLPEDRLEDYDWTELESRYHQCQAEMQDREQGIFQELSDLIAFFEVWADVGGRKETDRGFKRLKTQMTFVQHEEDELEAKRLHYIRVVDAFKTVGFMLKEPNWAQSFIPDHKSLSKVRRSISRQATPIKVPEKRKRDSRLTPLIKAEEWAVKVVGDVDMKERFSCGDPHVARCVIL